MKYDWLFLFNTILFLNWRADYQTTQICWISMDHCFPASFVNGEIGLAFDYWFGPVAKIVSEPRVGWSLDSKNQNYHLTPKTTHIIIINPHLINLNWFFEILAKILE